MGTVSINVKSTGGRETASDVRAIEAAVADLTLAADALESSFKAMDDASAAVETSLSSTEVEAQGLSAQNKELLTTVVRTTAAHVALLAVTARLFGGYGVGVAAAGELTGTWDRMGDTLHRTSSKVFSATAALLKFLAIHALYKIAEAGIRRYSGVVISAMAGAAAVLGRLTGKIWVGIQAWEGYARVAGLVGNVIRKLGLAEVFASAARGSGDIGRLATLFADLRKRAGLTNGAMIELAGSVRRVRDGFVGATRRGVGFVRMLKGQLLPILGLLVGAGLLFLAARGLVNFGRTGAAVLPVASAFENVTHAVGVASDTLLTDLTAATRRTVPELALMQGSVLALNSGAIQTSAHLTTLARSAQILGQTVGLDTATAFTNLIRGIGLVNPQLIKSVGVLVSAETAYRNYAKALGVGVEQLSDSQRHEAFRVETMRKLEEAVRRVGRQEEDLNIIFQQTAAATRDMSRSFSVAVAGSTQLVVALNELKVVAGGTALLLQNSFGGALRVFTDFLFITVRVAARLTPLVNGFVIIGQRAGEVKLEVDALARALTLLGEAEAVGGQARHGEQNLRLRQLFNELADVTEEMDKIQRFRFMPPVLIGWLIMRRRAAGFREELEAVELEMADLIRLQEELNGTGGGIAPIIPLGASADNLTAFSNAFDAANKQMEQLRLSAALPGADQAEIAVAFAALEIQIETLNRLRLESLQLASAEASLVDAQLAPWSTLVLMADDYATALQKAEIISRTLNDNILTQLNTAREITIERQRLNALAQGTLPSPASFAGDNAGLLSGLQQANISPFEAGTAVFGEGQSFATALQDFARLQEIQQEWSSVLEGNSVALQQLVLTGALSEAEATALAASLGQVAQASNQASLQIISSFGSGVEAMILGTDRLAESMVRAATRMIQISLAESNPFLGGLLGVVGGIAGALLGKRSEPQRVSLDRFSNNSLDQLKQARQTEPQVVTLQFIDPRTGVVTEQTHAELLRMEERDAVPRSPEGFTPTRVGR